MRQLRQLAELMDKIPTWGHLLISVFLVAYTAASIYGRVNTQFGAKIFSHLPESDIRSNTGHIFQYTIVPLIVTIGYFILLMNR